MRPNLPIPAPPQLAEVRTPTGAIWYVPRAKQHESFLVQRRYVGTGPTCYTNDLGGGRLHQHRERSVPVLVPYLNPGAVQAEGLDIATIMTWSAENPGQIFSHPTYASLCLRWGDNAHGYTVTMQAVDSVRAEKIIRVTPSTCWLTGTTYYKLVDNDVPEGSLFTTLVAQAGMLLHEQEIGLEGTWSGWCFTALEIATTILAAAGYQLYLACQPLYYGTWIYPDAPGLIHWITIGTTAEEALAFYQRLPEVSSRGQFGAIAMWRYTLSHPDQEPEWFPLSEKRIPLEYAIKLWQQQEIPYPNPVVVRQLNNGDLAPDEVPMGTCIPTLREFINAASLSRWQLSQRLHWTTEKLAYMEYRPWELTLIEIKELAKLLDVAQEMIVESLWHELQARVAKEALKLEQAEWRKTLAKTASNPS